MIKKIFSYLIPIKIYQTKSSLSKSIEVTWANGELVLDSENANYSYGSLQRILRIGLKNIGYEKIAAMERILVLGVAGGSVIKTLVDEINYKGKITGVEIDSDIIRIANKYFDLDKIPQLDIVIEDAFEFVLKTKNKYDLIIIDIFQDTTMPNFLFETYFINRICFLLRNRGFILFNTMILNESQNIRNQKYVSEFYENRFKIKTIPRVEVHNELIIIEKLE
ncbi:MULTISPECIES: spermidine synthase [Flavobacterium]|uniref:Spermidine synthase n=1 Tax=Flavobacterium gawalongense TaxID=2594432 RepID=A0A553BG71_9FLAO|nr:fused MFS/spermidine synthase [Flavobacterium gawalongense]TRW99898.1 spermidine synthase [Flavobacterium gawalongense]TRX04362.1 spermidine synthase [Flavobacterium gawalongense]TRX07249.1 spermidine synthase [Flavobacterium gawalongense]TRX08000.1 spermidine synthase [Flavobacterium gawalongense]TRX24252.1 spermidine synthase [Flavobacterium gawalongense]